MRRTLNCIGIGVVLTVAAVLQVQYAAHSAGYPATTAGSLPTGPDFSIADSPDHAEMYADVAYDGDMDEYLVVYDRDYGPGDRDVYGVHVSSDGHTVSEPFAIASSSNNETNPAVARNPDANSYLVVWQEYSDGTGENVWGRFVTPSTLSADFLIDGAEHDQTSPDVAYSREAQRYLVVWENVDPSLPDPSNIRGACVSLGGGIPDGLLDISTHSAGQYRPAVASSGYGSRWLVTWQDDVSDINSDVRAQAVERIEGCLLKNPELAIGSAEGTASAPAVAWGWTDSDSSAYGRFLVAWAENSSIWGQVVAGETLTTTGSTIVVSGADSLKGAPAVTWSTVDASWSVVWPDGRSSASAAVVGTLSGESAYIFGQRVGYDGTVLNPDVNERISRDPQDYVSLDQTGVALAYGDSAESSLVAWENLGHWAGDTAEVGIWGHIWGPLWEPSDLLFLPHVCRNC